MLPDRKPCVIFTWKESSAGRRPDELDFDQLAIATDQLSYLTDGF